VGEGRALSDRPRKLLAGGELFARISICAHVVRRQEELHQVKIDPMQLALATDIGGDPKEDAEAVFLLKRVLSAR